MNSRSTRERRPQSNVLMTAVARGFGACMISSFILTCIKKRSRINALIPAVSKFTSYNGLKYHRARIHLLGNTSLRLTRTNEGMTLTVQERWHKERDDGRKALSIVEHRIVAWLIYLRGFSPIYLCSLTRSSLTHQQNAQSRDPWHRYRLGIGIRGIGLYQWYKVYSYTHAGELYPYKDIGYIRMVIHHVSSYSSFLFTLVTHKLLG